MTATAWSFAVVVVVVSVGSVGDDVSPSQLSALATEGRLVVIGLQGGTKAELDLNALMRKRAAVAGTTLRARPVAEKATICAAVVEHVWPLVADGTIRPVVGRRFALAEAGEAHRWMESGESTGKILLVA